MKTSDIDTNWERYLAAERDGFRQYLLAALDVFVASLKQASASERENWIADICRRVVDQGEDIKVRMPLFREVLFPALYSGHEAKIPCYTRWLAGFSLLLYHCPDYLAQLPETQRSEHGLLLAAFALDPGDQLAKVRLIKILRSRFDYALHELPAGVLYGQDGATVEQCVEMATELEFYRRIVSGGIAQPQDEELIEEAAFHIDAYRVYLTGRNEGDTYESFLSSKTKK